MPFRHHLGPDKDLKTVLTKICQDLHQPLPLRRIPVQTANSHMRATISRNSSSIRSVPEPTASKLVPLQLSH